MIYFFWFLALPSGLLASLLLLMSLAGKALSAATPIWLTLLASAGVWASLIWAHHLATAAQRPGLGCGVVLLAWVLFAAVMLVNGLLRQTLWN